MERRGESIAAIAGGPAHSQRRGLHRGDSWRIPALAILCVLMIAPLIMAIIISFKSPSQFTRVPFLPTWPMRWENYEFAVQIISQFLLNSVITSGATVIGVLLLSSLAAYSFAQIPFPGRTIVFYAVLALMMVPASLTLVPSFALRSEPITALVFLHDRSGQYCTYCAPSSRACPAKCSTPAASTAPPTGRSIGTWPCR